jgi:hypothetical protein
MIESTLDRRHTPAHGRREDATDSVPVEIVVQEEIDNEIRDLRKRQEEVDSAAWQLQEQVDAAEAAMDANPKDPALKSKYENLHRALIRNINTGIGISQKLQELQHPSTFEVRVRKRESNKASLNRLKGATGMAKETAKDQGVPAVYLNDAGNFRIGMDARLKSDLVNSALGLITKEEPGDSLMVFSEKEAVSLLEKRSWTQFLDRKRELVEAKAAKSAAAAEKREATARERAEAKAAKDAERQAEKERKAAEREAAKASAASDSDSGNSGSSGKGKSTSKTDQLRAQREAQAAKAGS